MHTERTQNAHTQHRERQYAAHSTEHRTTHNLNTQKQKQRYMQHIQENTEQHTEQHTENRTQDTTICSAHNYRTYSFDLYHEYVCIKNSNTIELYTILQDKV